MIDVVLIREKVTYGDWDYIVSKVYSSISSMLLDIFGEKKIFTISNGYVFSSKEIEVPKKDTFDLFFSDDVKESEIKDYCLKIKKIEELNEIIFFLKSIGEKKIKNNSLYVVNPETKKVYYKEDIPLDAKAIIYKIAEIYEKKETVQWGKK